MASHHLDGDMVGDTGGRQDLKDHRHRNPFRADSTADRAHVPMGICASTCTEKGIREDSGGLNEDLGRGR